jgi:molecular chaperone GrpE
LGIGNFFEGYWVKIIKTSIMSEEKPFIDKEEEGTTDNNTGSDQPGSGTEENENSSTIMAEMEESPAKLSLEDELADHKDKYIRLYSDFENFKRRTSKERAELFRSAGQEVITALLPVLDDFERTMKAIENTKDTDTIKEGIYLVQQKLKTILAQKGLKEMDVKGKNFDADFHEAITNIPAPDESLKGKVVDEAEKGYFLNDKVIRYAKVVVGE